MVARRPSFGFPDGVIGQANRPTRATIKALPTSHHHPRPYGNHPTSYRIPRLRLMSIGDRKGRPGSGTGCG